MVGVEPVAVLGGIASIARELEIQIFTQFAMNGGAMVTKLTRAKRNENGQFEFRMYNGVTKEFVTEPMTEEQYRAFLTEQGVDGYDMRRVFRDAKSRGTSLFGGECEDLNRKEW